MTQHLSTLDKLANQWQTNIGNSFAHLSVVDQLRMIDEMNYSKRRADAMADAVFTGKEYVPPERNEDAMLAYNNLIIGDDAIKELTKNDQEEQGTERPAPQPPAQTQPPPDQALQQRNQSLGRILPAAMLAASLLIAGGAIAWSVYNSSQQPSQPPVLVWDIYEPPTPSAPAGTVPNPQ